MAETPQQDKAPSSVLERFRSGQVPKQGRLAAATGALPLPPEEQLLVLFLLRKDPEPEVRNAVLETVQNLPAATLKEMLQRKKIHPAIMDFYAKVCRERNDVLEFLLAHPSTHDKTVEFLAERVGPGIQSIIIVNQVRIERHPAIAAALNRNPKLDPSVRRRLGELEKIRRARPARPAPGEREPAGPPPPGPGEGEAPSPAAQPPAPAAAAAPPAPEPEPEPAEVPEAPRAEAPPPDTDPPAVAEDEEIHDALEALDADVLEDSGAAEIEEALDEELAGVPEDIVMRLSTMSVPEKVEAARSADKRTRGILIRDGAKKVQEAVLASPKMSDQEVEEYAGMRSVSEDVLRIIAGKRDWVKNKHIQRVLLMNPKTPVGVSMRLLPLQTTKFLQELIKNRNVPGALRAIANKMFQERTMPKTTFKKGKH